MSIGNGTSSQWYSGKAEIAQIARDIAERSGDLTWRHILDLAVSEAFAEENNTELREKLLRVASVANDWASRLGKE